MPMFVSASVVPSMSPQAGASEVSGGKAVARGDLDWSNANDETNSANSANSPANCQKVGVASRESARTVAQFNCFSFGCKAADEEFLGRGAGYPINRSAGGVSHIH